MIKNISSSLLLTTLLLSGSLTGITNAQADTVVVVNPNTNISEMQKSHLNKLFLGMVSNYPTGAVAFPIDQAGNAPARRDFYGSILGKTPEQLQKYWARMIFTGKGQPPREVKPSEIRQIIANTPGAIGYLDRAEVDGSVKVLTIK